MLLLKRKPLGGLYDRTYAWLGSRSGHKYVIHHSPDYKYFYYVIEKGGNILFDCLLQNITFRNVDEAGRSAEEWIRRHVQEMKGAKMKRRPLKERHKMLIKGLREMYEKYPGAVDRVRFEELLRRIEE
jgi:hypothetical protein